MDLDPLPAHSDLGASAMDRWSHCPGSFRLSQRERHRLPTVYAATGTVAHTLVERALGEILAGEDANAFLNAQVGVTHDIDGHAVTVDEPLIDGVTMMLTYLLKRSDALGGITPLVEQTVFVDGYFPADAPPPVRMFGRADTQFRTRDLLEVVDYKNGTGVLVNVVDHPQLLFYAAGALAAIPPEDMPNYVRLTVVQPNARTQDKITSHDLTTMDVLLWVEDVMIPAVRACEARDAPYVVGSWCGFCPVTHACPKLLEEARTVARLQFDDSAEAQVVADNLRLAEEVALWAEAMKGYALERAKSGLNIPGWAIRPTRPRRLWTDANAVGRMLTGAGVDPFRRELQSPAQIEKLLRRAPATWQLVSPFIDSRSSGVKLARVTGDDPGDMFDVTDPA